MKYPLHNQSRHNMQLALAKRISLSLTLVSILGFTQSTIAKPIEETISVPVQVNDAYNRIFAQTLVVKVFYDDESPKPYPVAVINHGRAVRPDQRAAINLSGYMANARWLAKLGYIVAVPARIGYGESGGNDIEDTGTCNKKNYPPAYDAGAEQTLQVIQALRQRMDASQEKGIVVGQSMGGSISIATAAKNPVGIQATINFAGGGGGNPETHPGNPCSAYLLERMFGNYGKTAKVSTLWVYTANDQWMGEKPPKDWFAAFTANGGVGEFLALPANGADGHGVFTRDTKAWRPQVEAYLRTKGLIYR